MDIKPIPLSAAATVELDGTAQDATGWLDLRPYRILSVVVQAGAQAVNIDVEARRHDNAAIETVASSTALAGSSDVVLDGSHDAEKYAEIRVMVSGTDGDECSVFLLAKQRALNRP